MTFGQAYADILTLRARELLKEACDWLIDHCFEEYGTITNSADLNITILGGFLPQHYGYKYTPLFFKRFAVCIITVAWKLAQSTHQPLSSLAEELAAWVVIEQAKAFTEEEKDGAVTERSLNKFVDLYFEDLDFQFLYNGIYDGLDKDEVAQILGISSLSFDDWFKPFSDEPSRIAHPYAM